MTDEAEVMAADASFGDEPTLSRAKRRRGGVYYTPPDVARGLVRAAFDGVRPDDLGRPAVCDPACGAGALLLAAAEHLEQRGFHPAEIVDDLLWGADIDRDAVAAARAALEGWARARGAATSARHLVVADPLAVGARAWPDRPVGGFSAVVGNPPFQSQLAAATSRTPRRAAAARQRFGSSAAPYTDSATLFLVLACDLVAPGGRVALIQPESMLSARDAGPARAAVLDGADLVGVWWAGEPVFDAGVQVCAPVLERRTATSALADRPVRRWRGRAFEAMPPAPGELVSSLSWSPLLATLRGTPEVELVGPGTLADVAVTSAGFRQQFYGVAPHVREGDRDEPAVPGGPVRLVTSGLIDPLHCRWGQAATRFARRTWHAPVVDLDGLRVDNAALAAWADERLVPKVVLATQTKVLEVVVDRPGRMWPSVPTISVVPQLAGDELLWRLAALVSSPAATAWAHTRFAGAALSSDAVKLSAAQVLGLPLPHDDAAWRSGAGAARRAHEASTVGDSDGWRVALDDLGAAMADAHGVGRSVNSWWVARRPAWR